MSLDVSKEWRAHGRGGSRRPTSRGSRRRRWWGRSGGWGRCLKGCGGNPAREVFGGMRGSGGVNRGRRGGGSSACVRGRRGRGTSVFREETDEDPGVEFIHQLRRRRRDVFYFSVRRTFVSIPSQTREQIFLLCLIPSDLLSRQLYMLYIVGKLIEKAYRVYLLMCMVRNFKFCIKKYMCLSLRSASKFWRNTVNLEVHA